MTLDDAKPCPFCGYADLEFDYRGSDDEWVAVACKSCTAVGPVGDDRESVAVEMWNARHASAGTAEREAIATAHARRLVVALHQRHFPNAPKWEPAGDLITLIDQIDNVTTALRPYDPR